MGRKFINLLQQLEKVLRQRAGPAAGLVEHQVHGARRNRHGVIVVVNLWKPVFKGHLDVFPLKFGAILITQDGQKKLIAQGGFEWLPVNVKIFGISRGVAILQNVLPPDGVVPNPHVVGNDVEKQAQALAVQLRRKVGKTFLSAELGIEPVVPGQVIPVHTAGPGLEDGRRVEVSDAELFKVADNVLRVGEREAFVHLHPISRDRDSGIRVHHSFDALPHFVGGFLARVGFYRGRFRHGYARRGNLVGD